MKNIKKNISKDVAKTLLEVNAVSFRTNPPFTYTSGLKSPIYLDNRIIMSYPKQRKKIINYYIQVLKEIIGLKNIDYISGTATAAIPQASWVAQKLNLPMVYVRPSTKSYGKGNKLEGHLKKRARVVIIEDHISTATSVINNAQMIRQAGGLINCCVTTTTYETKKSNSMLKKHKIKVIALTTGKDIVSEALKQGVIKAKDKEAINSWFQDPIMWGKKMGFEV